MGYTHYWQVRNDLPRELIADAASNMTHVLSAVIARGEPTLGTPHGDERLVGELDWRTNTCVFNGYGSGAHETFYWGPDTPQGMMPGSGIGEPGWGFWFCKTAQKPYDPVVVACLFVAQDLLGEGIKISSDASDWKEFIGDYQSEGWMSVNSMIGHPIRVEHELNAVQLYEMVFDAKPPIPPTFAASV